MTCTITDKNVTDKSFVRKYFAMTRVLVATECSEEMQMQSSKLNSIVWNAVAGCADGFKPLTGSLAFCGVLAISCG